MVNLPFDQRLLSISQFLLFLCFFADQFEERESSAENKSLIWSKVWIFSSMWWRELFPESLDGLSFRGFVKYRLVQLCIVCRKIKVNKHCEIFYFSFGCLKGCSGYFAYVLESQMRGDEVHCRIAENAECRRMMCCSYITFPVLWQRIDGPTLLAC